MHVSLYINNQKISYVEYIIKIKFTKLFYENQVKKNKTLKLLKHKDF